MLKLTTTHAECFGDDPNCFTLHLETAGGITIELKISRMRTAVLMVTAQDCLRRTADHSAEYFAAEVNSIAAPVPRP